MSEYEVIAQVEPDPEPPTPEPAVSPENAARDAIEAQHALEEASDALSAAQIAEAEARVRYFHALSIFRTAHSALMDSIPPPPLVADEGSESVFDNDTLITGTDFAQ